MNSVWRGSSSATSAGWGSLTLTISSASPNTASASGTIVAPWAAYASSAIAEPDAGAALHEHLVPGVDQLAHARRRQRHPVLVRLDLGWNPDLTL